MTFSIGFWSYNHSKKIFQTKLSSVNFYLNYYFFRKYFVDINQSSLHHYIMFQIYCDTNYNLLIYICTISGSLLLNCHVIVTSRPHTLSHLQSSKWFLSLPKRMVSLDIQGLSDEGIQSFIHRYVLSFILSFLLFLQHLMLSFLILLISCFNKLIYFFNKLCRGSHELGERHQQHVQLVTPGRREALQHQLPLPVSSTTSTVFWYSN